jgi:hypothetical protein
MFLVFYQLQPKMLIILEKQRVLGLLVERINLMKIKTNYFLDVKITQTQDS